MLKNRAFYFNVFSIFFILIDQLIKMLIEINFNLFESLVVLPGFLKLTYLQNYGAAFGIFKNKRLFLVLITVLLLIFFTWFFLNFKVKKKIYFIVFSMLISGALGNLIDRIFRGYVVDYLDLLFWPFENFAVFNFADLLTVIGCFILLIKIIFCGSDFEIFYKKNKKVKF